MVRERGQGANEEGAVDGEVAVVLGRAKAQERGELEDGNPRQEAQCRRREGASRDREDEGAAGERERTVRA